MSNDLIEMYGNVEHIPSDIEHSIDVSKKGFLTEIVINGKTIQVIEPKEYLKLFQIVEGLKTRLRLAETSITTLQSRLNQKDKEVRTILNELDTKIGYDR